MSFQNVAILSCVSFNVDCVKRQLTNYCASHGAQAKHFLHVASDGNIDLAELEGLPSIFLDASSSSFKTSELCNFGGQIANSKRLKRSKEEFGYVYIHTDADLIIKGNLVEHVNEYQCGFLKHKPSSAWPHYERMMADPCFAEMRKYLDISDDEIYSGRQEGAFFPIDLWFEMASIFEKFYPESFFEQRHLLWPIEEGIVPTIASKLLASRYAYDSSANNIVVTKPLKPSPDKRNPRDLSENCVNIADIEKTLEEKPNETCIAMKWFSRKGDDPAAIVASNNLKNLEKKLVNGEAECLS